MGGSFPGIVIPAANQLSVPQSGYWCGQVYGFADSEREITVTSSRPAWRERSKRRNYTGHDNVA